MKQLNNVNHIHFLGICGYLMSGVAITLKKQGFKITGSDQGAYPPTTHLLKEEGIDWSKHYSAHNLKEKPDLVVIGAHISANNPEAKAAIEKKFKTTSLPALIYKIFQNKKRIVIAGTHGKTTTTSLLAWILQSAKLNPSYLIGGLLKNTNRGYQSGKGKYVVIEGDEYRTAFFDQKPKILHYHPDIAILTTCELDHPDYFPNLSQVKKAFLQFLKMVSKNGLIVLGIDDPQVNSLQKEIKGPVITYGLTPKADYQAKNIVYREGKTEFEVIKKGQSLAKFSLTLPGQINVQNALTAIAVTDQLNIPVKIIHEAVASFQGARRRFEVVGVVNDIVVIDDYAHHPTKIAKTLKAAQEKYPQARILVVFEPHTYSRTKALFENYLQALKLADEAIITPLFPAREKGQKPTVTSQDLVNELRKLHASVHYIKENQEIVKYLKKNLKKGDIVIIMSVGGLDNLARSLFNRLKK